MVLNYCIEQDIDIRSFLLSHRYTESCYLFLRENGNCFYVNGKPAEDYHLKQHDVFEVRFPYEESNVPEVNKPVEILYEDEGMIALNKPRGLATMPSFAHYEDHLLGRVKHYFRENGKSTGLHLVNRLDLETEGIVIIAKNSFVQNLMRETEILKEYTCTVQGILEKEHGFIDSPIRRVPGDGKKRECHPEGKNALTEYDVLGISEGNTRLHIILHTGRTHQIRVHMSSISHPLVGDILYGGKQGVFDLTCIRMSFQHPISEKTIVLSNKQVCYNA